LERARQKCRVSFSQMLKPDRPGNVFKRRTLRVLWLLCLLHLVAAGRADAYVDPGASGLMSQFLYVLFYGGMAVFFYFFRHLKSRLTALKEFLTKLFSRLRS